MNLMVKMLKLYGTAEVLTTNVVMFAKKILHALRWGSVVQSVNLAINAHAKRKA